MICAKCGWWDRLCHCKPLEVFNTPNDTWSNFVDVKNFGRPMHFSSLGEFERECKKRGLHTLTQSDMRHKMKNIKTNEITMPSRKEIRECVAKEIFDKGMYHKLGR